jgi:hypothetical protein
MEDWNAQATLNTGVTSEFRITRTQIITEQRTAFAYFIQTSFQEYRSLFSRRSRNDSSTKSFLPKSPELLAGVL